MDTTRNYRKRYRRSKEPPSFRLQDRDVELLALLGQYRYLNVPIIRVLQPWGLRNLRRRLEYLFQDGLVNRPRGQHVPLASPQPLVYTLSNAGARLLAQRLEIGEFTDEQGYGEQPLAQALRGLEEVKLNIDWNENSGRAKLPYIEHALMIARFRAALTATLRDHPNMRLIRWRQGPEIKGAANVDGERVAVAPDGLFTLEDGEDLLHFCLEADRGTMTLSRFREKLRVYWCWYLEGGHRRGWGMEAAFRVLSLTTSEKRRDNLWALAREVGNGGQASAMFLFAWEGDFDVERPETVFGETWRCGKKGCERRHGIVE